MKISVLAYEQPDPEGTAAGRALWAWCEGMLSLGHCLKAWSWYPIPPRRSLPQWCDWHPVGTDKLWRAHLRGLAYPRHDSARLGWQPPGDAVAVADDVPSFAAVAPASRSVVTIHYRAMADARALREIRPAWIQTARAERRADRQAALVLSLSERAGRKLKHPARFVPIAYPMPQAPLDLVEEPTAGLIADWSWKPNQKALDILLGLWPDVHEKVPSAKLVLAGRNLEKMSIGTMSGVTVLGEVGTALEVLTRCALVAFPCPATSGPKVKVLEALAHGVCVATTPAGIEGIVLDRPGSVGVALQSGFADLLAGLLVSPEKRAEMGAAGRASVLAHHGPVPAALTRLELFNQTFGAGI